jgi:rhodanese-related sulfurtransferase
MFDFLKNLTGGSTEGKVDLRQIIHSGAMLVDVRSPSEFRSGSVQGAVNIPLETLTENLSKFKGKENIVVFCRSGNRSGHAKSVLESKGIANVYNGGPWTQVHQLMQS